MSLFPTTSSSAVELDHYHWNGAKLVELAKAAAGRKEHAGPSGVAKPPTPPPSALEGPPPPAPAPNQAFHLHTWTLEVSMITPESHHYYPRQDEMRVNPDFKALQDLHAAVAGCSEPLVPFEILPPSKDWLRSPAPIAKTPGRYFTRSRISIAAMYHPRQPTNKGRPVMDLGQPFLGGAKEWLQNSSASDTQGWLQALLALDPEEPPTRKGKYRKEDGKTFWTESSLAVTWVPETDETPLRDFNGNELQRLGYEWKMIVTVNVYVDLTRLAEPQPELGHDLQGLILYSLLPAPVTPTYKTESKARQAALRNFYECMKPAPLLPRHIPISSLQPKEMTATLHPFQLRTLALLLQRERSTLLGGLEKPSTLDPAGWWTEMDFGEAGRYAYRRLTGELIRIETASSALVKGKGREMDIDEWIEVDGLSQIELRALPGMMDLSGIRGTMLCEEMGLGKTVEAIGLMLLHQHPRSIPRLVGSSFTNVQSSGSRAILQEVPVIDLFGGPPDLDDIDVAAWLQAQGEAFDGTRRFDETTQVHVTEVGATLVVTPPSLLKQWVAEIRTHSPHLRVCVYDGWQSLIKSVRRQKDANIRAETKRKQAADRKRKAAAAQKYRKVANGGRLKIDLEDSDSEDDKDGIVESENSLLEVTQRQFLEYVRAHDVVITTYQDLSSDLTVANPVAQRSRRANANYRLNERPRSPLIMVEWWRIIMDEVQLCADSSQAANMVTLIPRKNSLAVSGTPAKSDIDDLLGSLRFLGVPVLPHNHRLWHRLQQPTMRPAFQGLFQQITVRTTKQEVTDELHIPPQTRYIVPIELSDIEAHYYQDTLERQQGRLRGGAGELDRTLLRSCLLDLRQICTHLQVGNMQEVNRAQGRGQRLHLGRQVMTMKEALDVMRTDHATEFQLEVRNQLRLKIRKAQLHMIEEDPARFMKANDLYEAVRKTSEDQLVKSREHLATLLEGHGDSDKESDIDSEDGPPKHLSQQEREKAMMIAHAKSGIRELLQILHQAWFFEGDTRHQQKEIEREIQCYNSAEEVRKEILREPLKKASASITSLAGVMERGNVINHIEDLQTTMVLHGGLLSTEVCTQANALLGLLNDNAQLVWEWRNKIVELLSSPIESVADDPAEKGVDVENPEEEFYAEALEAQGKVESYLIAYAAAIADRKEMMIEDRSTLVEHEARLNKARGTRTAKDAAIDYTVVAKLGEVSEEAQNLLVERQKIRNKRFKHDCERPLKAMLADLSQIELNAHREEERQLCRGASNAIKDYNKTQLKVYDRLNTELEKFRAVFNQRVKYFAALQAISDLVTAPDDWADLKQAIHDCAVDIGTSEGKIARMIVKGRYLLFLASKDESIEEMRESCIICMGSSEDENGLLLECGHYFCASCMTAYKASTQGRKCPSCRSTIEYKNATKIKMPAEGPPVAIPGSPEVATATSSATAAAESADDSRTAEEVEAERAAADLERLRYMSYGDQAEIGRLDILGEWGSKINFLVKHLLWSKAQAPTTRHVIFSNWSDSLWIVTRALDMNGITFAAFESGRKTKDVVERFQNDPSITVFLLHAERESSGLTLTSCSVVHLLEPVLQHSFELQAIGRVDRLGQKKETQVYCYATRNTVESRILVRGVRNSTSIYLKDDTADAVVANMPNVASAAHRFGDLSNEGNEEELLGLIM